MTFSSDPQPDTAKILGTLSPGPKRKTSPRRRYAAIGGAFAALGVFVHCVLPLMIGL